MMGMAGKIFDLFSDSENDHTYHIHASLESEHKQLADFFTHVREIAFAHFAQRVVLDEYSVLCFINTFNDYIGKRGYSFEISSELDGLDGISQQQCLINLEKVRSRLIMESKCPNKCVILQHSKKQLENSTISMIGVIFNILSLLQSVAIKSTHRKLLNTYLYLAIADMLYNLMLIWLDTQCPVAYVSTTQDVTILSLFPEFNKNIEFECIPSVSVIESFLINAAKYAGNDILIDMTSSSFILDFISFLVSSKQLSLLRRFESVLSIRAKYVSNIENEIDFECDRYFSYRIRLLMALISFGEGIQYSFPIQNFLLQFSFCKIAEEFMKSTHAISLLKFHNEKQKNSSLNWRLSPDDSQKLLSASYFHNSLESLEHPLNYFQSIELVHIVQKCNILELLKSTEKLLPFHLVSQLCIRSAYELLAIITTIKPPIGIIKDLHKLISKYYCNLVEYSLKLHCLEECTSSISLFQRYISLQLREDKCLFDESIGIWRNCVRLAVIHACNFAKLDWLCSTSLGNENNDISFGRTVKEILYLLAKSTDVQRVNVACGDISYYECLIIYLLSSNDSKEASRVMWMYYDRIKSITSIVFSRHMVIQLWALSMCAHILFISHDQEYLLLNMASESMSLTHHDNGCMNSVTLKQLDDRVTLLYSKVQLLSRLKYIKNIPPNISSKSEVITRLLRCGLAPHAFSLTQRHDKSTIPYIAAALLSLISDMCESHHYPNQTAIRSFETETSFSRGATLNTNNVDLVIDFLCKFDKREYDSYISGIILSTQSIVTSRLDELIHHLNQADCLSKDRTFTRSEEKRGLVNFFEFDKNISVVDEQLTLSKYFENSLLSNI